MACYIVIVNSRVGPDADETFRRTEAARTIRIFLAPIGQSFTDSEIPERLVSESMIDRFLAIEPPVFRTPSEYEAIIESIERSYVIGMYFPALAAAVVTIERLLNGARLALHPLVARKIPTLWNKGPLNEWEGNIAALAQWGYIDEELARELRELFEVRCRYLHSGPVAELEADALGAVRGAYALLRCLIGFPSRLFTWGEGAVRCLDPDDPLVKAFYRPVPAPTEGA